VHLRRPSNDDGSGVVVVTVGLVVCIGNDDVRDDDDGTPSINSIVRKFTV